MAKKSAPMPMPKKGDHMMPGMPPKKMPMKDMPMKKGGKH